MTEEKKTKEIDVYGMLKFMGDAWYLLSPYMMKTNSNHSEWRSGQDDTFYVCPFPTVENEVLIPRHIIVHGDYFIDFLFAGRKVKIQTQEVDHVTDLDDPQVARGNSARSVTAN